MNLNKALAIPYSSKMYEKENVFEITVEKFSKKKSHLMFDTNLINLAILLRIKA